MPFEFQTQPLPCLVLVVPRVFGDARGSFLATFRASEFAAAGIEGPFVQDNFSISTRGVVRGLHYQRPPSAQGKLVFVTRGVVWDVCVDVRRSSATVGRWSGVTLSEEDHRMLYVPPGFAHGFVALSEVAHFQYKCTREYDPAAERGVRWDDPALAIEWPLRDATVSAKDAALPLLSAAQPFD
jgi:dTDP-4-dehydrorhamnose 3,5-epimerase